LSFFEVEFGPITAYFKRKVLWFDSFEELDFLDLHVANAFPPFLGVVESAGSLLLAFEAQTLSGQARLFVGTVNRQVTLHAFGGVELGRDVQLRQVYFNLVMVFVVE